LLLLVKQKRGGVDFAVFFLMACSQFLEAISTQASLKHRLPLQRVRQRIKIFTTYTFQVTLFCELFGRKKQHSMQQHPLLRNYLTWVTKQLSGSVQPQVEFNQQPKDERLYSGYLSQLIPSGISSKGTSHYLLC